MKNILKMCRMRAISRCLRPISPVKGGTITGVCADYYEGVLCEDTVVILLGYIFIPCL